jgi:hypothetical protein
MKSSKENLLIIQQRCVKGVHALWWSSGMNPLKFLKKVCLLKRNHEAALRGFFLFVFECTSLH